jgi:glutamyl/glutaminyl-tRNA synthetase
MTRAMPSSQISSSYRGRLAPSPTGLLHLGHARTFWTAYQRAQAEKGALVLRNEDLDPERSRQEFVDAMIEDLRWLGVVWQEGPGVGGAFSPYSQSERRDFYLAAWRRLLAAGWIYPCRCSRRDLARAAQAPHEDEGIYPGTCRPEQATFPAATATPVGRNWRFRLPQNETVEFEDGHLGPQRLVAGKDFGDFLVWRRDDVPAYQLAVVVDDAAMEITEVVRGADLLRSTARQILLARALGLRSPAWYHCDLMLDEHGQRLAKRQDALSLRALRGQGKSPEEAIQMATAIPARSG